MSASDTSGQSVTVAGQKHMGPWVGALWEIFRTRGRDDYNRKP